MSARLICGTVILTIISSMFLSVTAFSSGNVRETPVVKAAAKVGPAIVNISTERVITVRNDPFFGFHRGVFTHFAVDNIRGKTIRDILKSPFMTAVRNGIPYDSNMLRACMIIDRPEVLREYFARYHAYPTHDGAESIVTTFTDQVDDYAHNVASIFNHVWQNGDSQKI